MIYNANPCADPGGLFNVLTKSMPDFVWLADGSGNVEFVNKAWIEFTGLSEAESCGKGWLKALHPDDAEYIQSLWQDPHQNDETYETKIRCRRVDGSYYWYLVRANFAEDGVHWIGCSTNIHDHILAQKKDQAQIEILSMVASGAPVETVLQALCELGEGQLPGCRCTVLLLDEGGTEFESCAATFLPDHLQALLPGTKIGTGVGSCGTAAFERRDVVSPDIATDPLWKDWHEVMAPLGIKSCWSRPVFGSDGRVVATLGFYFFQERTPNEEEFASLDNLRHIASVAIEKARQAEALRESEEHYRHTVEHNPQIPWTADPSGRLLSVSSRWTEATGLPFGAARENGWFKALHPEDVDPTIVYWCEKLRTGENVDIKYRIRLQDGTYRWVRSRGAARRDKHGNILRWYGAVEDIHDLELITQKLQRQVYQDDLTQLHNWRGMEEALRKSLHNVSQGGAPPALLIVDIESFRHVNDRFGHETGDAVLRLFGRHLRASAVDACLVGRIAGDEFALIFEQPLDDLQLHKRARQLSRELNQRLGRSSKTKGYTTNIGCALAAIGDTPDSLRRRASRALRAAKSDAHCPTKLFTPALLRADEEKDAQSELARKALQAQWIEPYYQPMVVLKSGRVAGAESLLRIAHPERGVLGPGIIWAALDAPKISKLVNDRMLSLVVADLSRWKPWPKEFGNISVNMSTEMLLQDGLARSILRRLERHEIMPWQLTVEITERVLIDELAQTTHRALTELQRNGVRISLDDFGTGFASLTHLQKLPLNEIKIDRSFVEGITAGGPNAAIVKSMISLANNMGVDVVAEGVETADQARLLREWGCGYAQGYHFYKPMPGGEFSHLYAKARKTFAA